MKIRFYNEVCGTLNFKPFTYHIKEFCKNYLKNLKGFYLMTIDTFIMTAFSYELIVTFHCVPMTNIEVALRVNSHYSLRNKYKFEPIIPEDQERCDQFRLKMIDPSRLMISFQSSVAKIVNHSYKNYLRKGHLWKARFKYEILQVIY